MTSGKKGTMTSKRLTHLVYGAFIISSVFAESATVDSRIGKLEFTHDFANGYPTRETVERLYDARDFSAPAKRTWGRSQPCHSLNGSA